MQNASAGAVGPRALTVPSVPRHVTLPVPGSAWWAPWSAPGPVSAGTPILVPCSCLTPVLRVGWFFTLDKYKYFNNFLQTQLSAQANMPFPLSQSSSSSSFSCRKPLQELLLLETTFLLQNSAFQWLAQLGTLSRSCCWFRYLLGLGYLGASPLTSVQTFPPVSRSRGPTGDSGQSAPLLHPQC